MIGFTPDILARGRELALTRMSETVRIGQFEDGVDPATGDATRVLAVARYEGEARVKHRDVAVSAANGPGQVFVSQRVEVSIPAGSPACAEGDEVLVVASTADPLLVGRRYTVQGTPQHGQTTAHRYPVEELT